MTWLAHAGPLVSGGAAGMVLSGSATAPTRGARRIDAVSAVRGMTVHAVATGEVGGHLVPLLFEVAVDRWRRDPWLWRPAPSATSRYQS
jgi:integrase/recombinase XerD